MHLWSDYVYLMLCGYFAVIWMVLWILNPRLRKEMLFLSLSGMMLAPWIEIVLFQDWYQPVSIFGNAYFKVESLMCGFCTAGISGIVFQALTGQVYSRTRHAYRPAYSHEIAGFWGGLGLFYGVWLLGFHSFYASLLSCSFMAFCFAFRRPDLIVQMVMSAMTMLLLVLPGYWVLLLINHSFFSEQWMLGNLSGLWVAGLPVEELLWYSYSSAVFAAAWKVHTGVCLKKELSGRPKMGWYKPLDNNKAGAV